VVDAIMHWVRQETYPTEINGLRMGVSAHKVADRQGKGTAGTEGQQLTGCYDTPI